MLASLESTQHVLLKLFQRTYLYAVLTYLRVLEGIIPIADLMKLLSHEDGFPLLIQWMNIREMKIDERSAMIEMGR